MIHDAVSSGRAALVASVAAVLTAASPAVAAAPGSGATIPPVESDTSTVAAAPATPAAPAGSRVRPQITITTARAAGELGDRAVYAGRVVGAHRGDRVRLDVRTGRNWRSVAGDVVADEGRFRVTKQISSIGRRPARIRVVGSETVSSTHRRVSRVHGFRRSYASYFGPGLYGSALACGGRLSPSTPGVAHKTLPCGTRVTLRLGSRQVTTRVVDRGPYIAGREFDLTTATRNALGFGDIGPVLVDR